MLLSLFKIGRKDNKNTNPFLRYFSTSLTVSVAEHLEGVGLSRFEGRVVEQQEVLVQDNMAGLAFGQDGVAQTLREEIAERQVEDMLLLEAVALHPAEAEIRGGLHGTCTSCIRTFHLGSP